MTIDLRAGPRVLSKKPVCRAVEDQVIQSKFHKKRETLGLLPIGGNEMKEIKGEREMGKKRRNKNKLNVN